MALSARCVSWLACWRPPLALEFNRQSPHPHRIIANYLVTCNSEALMMTFAILGLIAFLGISLIPIYILRRREYARAREYFVASEPTPGGSYRIVPLPTRYRSPHLPSSSAGAPGAISGR